LLWSLHHILLDCWSVAVVLGEVMRLYEGVRRGEQGEPERRRSFEEYVQWLGEQDGREAEAYWRSVLAGVQAATVLAGGSRREEAGEETAQKPTGYRKQELALSREETQRLEGLAREQRVTVNTLVQGMWALLLSRYSGERRVIFGVTVAGRPPELEGVERMIGMFINTLPLVIEVGGEQRLDEWLQGVQASNVGLRQYEQTPLVQVQEWSQVPRGQPLFESLLVFENYPEEVTTHLQNVREATLHSPTTFERTNYPITLVALPGKQLRLSVSYERERFEDETIERLLDHCQQILRQMLAQPGSRLVQLSLLTQAERQQVLSDWNQTSRDYPRQSNVPALFQAQVARTPDRIALCLQDACLTYAELNARANQLARYLQRLGVGPEVPVGLYLHRCVELPLSILAILKAGGVYVPLDLNAPASRLAFLQADTGFSLLISQPEHLARLASLPVQPLLLKEHWTRINACPAHELRTDGQAEHLAYIMYTSGSTGLPKGTGVSHRNVLRLVLNTDYASFGQEETWLLFASPAFDASTLELWGALLHGSRLVIVPAALPSLAELGRLLQVAAITSLWLTAGLFHQMVDAERESLASVRQVLAGGDVLSPTHVRSLLQSWEPGTHWLINGYGPTEATTFSCCYPMSGPEVLAASSTVPIGRPIANTQ